jgi:hypothetical protein
MMLDLDRDRLMIRFRSGPRGQDDAPYLAGPSTLRPPFARQPVCIQRLLVRPQRNALLRRQRRADATGGTRRYRFGAEHRCLAASGALTYAPLAQRVVADNNKLSANPAPDFHDATLILSWCGSVFFGRGAARLPLPLGGQRP